MRIERLVGIIALIGIGLAMRLIPHPPNMTPTTALALVGARYAGTKVATYIVFGTMVVSDLFIGLYDVRIMACVYLSFAMTALMARWSVKYSASTTILVAVLSAIIFFLVTNAAVWLFSPWYEKSLEGLMLSYANGLPFLRNMLIGDVLYTSGLLISFASTQKFIQNASYSFFRRVPTP